MNAQALMRRLLLLLTLLALALAPNLGYAQSPSSDDGPGSEDSELKGLIETLPAAGRVGEWTVAGKAFQVNTATVFFGFGTSTPGIGRCVEVKLNTATPPVALVIKPDDDCSTPEVGGEMKWRGKVSEAPASGFVGSYTIGGQPFSATEATFFEGFGATPPALNDCVEVEYVLDGTTKVATKIQREDNCTQAGAPGEDHSARARVDARPDGTRSGAWVIGGRSFVADANTTFGPSLGSDAARPTVGDCVALSYLERNNVRTLVTMRAATCETPDDNDGAFEAHGALTARPDGKAGTWTIGGINYTATTTVELKTAFGPLLVKEPPVCVKVHYSLDATSARVAREIESRPDYRCAASGDDHELYGEIKALPSSPYLGKWTIGTLEVQVTRDTKLEDGPFLVGRLVKVKFIQAGDGTMVALKIEGHGTPGKDDDAHERGGGKAYGAIETLGAVPGTWTIAGQAYAVTAETRLRSSGTDFAVGDCVEVYFQADATGKRTAVKIERKASECRVGERGRTFGFVEVMPTGGYTGTWTVGGVSYTATVTTEFEFEAGVGAPTVGSFVRVTYVQTASGEKIAKQIKTLVPPGMGDETRIGTLSTTGVAADLGAATWTVSGVSIQLTDATLIQDGATDVANGALVKVNGYRDANGNLVATQIAAVSIQYLPLVLR